VIEGSPTGLPLAQLPSQAQRPTTRTGLPLKALHCGFESNEPYPIVHGQVTLSTLMRLAASDPLRTLSRWRRLKRSGPRRSMCEPMSPAPLPPFGVLTFPDLALLGSGVVAELRLNDEPCLERGFHVSRPDRYGHLHPGCTGLARLRLGSGNRPASPAQVYRSRR